MDNYILNVSKELSVFCEPFFKQTGIKFFEHTSMLNGKTTLMINTDPDYLKYFLYKKYCRFVPEGYKQPIYLWEATKEFSACDQQLLDMRVMFNYNYGITFIEKTHKVLDAFSFTASNSSFGIVNYYLNNFDILKKFISKYLEKFYARVNYLLLKHPMDILLINPDNFQNNLIKSSNTTNNINFTSREFEIVRLLAEGHTAKTTAKILSISPRTVEKYFEKLKEKLNVRYKFELIEKFIEYKKLQSSFDI